ncbi:MAG: anaerobic carbon-monoxide dehydrogenase catalytic subunit [bacterium]
METHKETYKTSIIEGEIGGLKIGGENTLPFYEFEGNIPNPPRIALEIWDEPPLNWPGSVMKPYEDVLNNPVSWAKKAISYGADIICLKLMSTDPLGSNRSPSDASKTAKDVSSNIPAPLIVLGCGNIEKDSIVLKEIASACEGKNILLGAATEDNYKPIGAAALGYKHNVSAQTPIDVNLAKQLNILLGNLGLSDNKIFIDPTGSALGYGLEYTYSIIERIRQAALQAGDEKLKMPIFVETGKDCWKIKELREDNPQWGDIEKRGILWEAITGISFLLAGADILVMRHPSSMKLLKELINELRGKREEKIEEKRQIKKEEAIYVAKEEEKIEGVKRHPGDSYKPSWIDEDISSFFEKKEALVYSSRDVSLQKAKNDGAKTVFDRAQEIKPCPFGEKGACCKHCAMGPCRLSFKDESEEEQERGDKTGLCGATIGTISARNFARMIAAGASAHSDHGREVAEILIAVAEKKAPGYSIKDVEKLYKVAKDFDIETEGKDKYEIAKELGEKALAEFGKQQGELTFIKRMPLTRQNVWKKLGMTPRGIDREVVEIMHRTHIGVDQDYRNILFQGSRCALADGYGGSMIATELQDILFGSPKPILSRVNLGVLREDCVNIIIHGHEPLLSEMVVEAAKNPRLLELAKKEGAKGINLAGICCTANEVLMRHGISLAGNFLQQELAIATGAVEAMVVDVQCIFQSLPKVSQCYHTKVISTSSKGKIPGALHIEFDPHNALVSAEKIVETAILNFKNRKKEKVNIPEESMDLVAGFTHEYVNYMLGGRFRASYWPLNDNIINGKIRGVVGAVGCNNPRVALDSIHIPLVKELIKNNVLVLQTGCAAIACAKAGLLTPEAAKFAGSGLAEVCEATGMPPVLHCGSCVDNSRLLVAGAEMVKVGGLGDDVHHLPIAGCAPEWMSEKAIAIGHYFMATGLLVAFGVNFPTLGSKATTRHLFEEYEGLTGGMWAYEPDPYKMAELLIAHIDKKREALGINKPKERILYDMEARRELKF